MGEKSYTERVPCSKSVKKEIDECKEIFSKDKGLDGQYVTYNSVLKSMIKVYKNY